VAAKGTDGTQKKKKKKVERKRSSSRPRRGDPFEEKKKKKPKGLVWVGKIPKGRRGGILSFGRKRFRGNRGNLNRRKESKRNSGWREKKQLLGRNRSASGQMREVLFSGRG